MHPNEGWDEGTLCLTIQPVMDAIKDQQDSCQLKYLLSILFSRCQSQTVSASHDDEVPGKVEARDRCTLHGQSLRIPALQLTFALHRVKEGVLKVKLAVPGGFLAEIVEDARRYVVQGEEPFGKWTCIKNMAIFLRECLLTVRPEGRNLFARIRAGVVPRFGQSF